MINDMIKCIRNGMIKYTIKCMMVITDYMSYAQYSSLSVTDSCDRERDGGR